MPRKTDPLRSAIQEAVRVAIADDARAVDRKARQEARRQEREADALLAAADPQVALRERLNQIEEQLASSSGCTSKKAMRSLAGSPKPWSERERNSA